MMEEKIWRFMRSERMYGKGSKIIAGVSGGKDSMFLIDVLDFARSRDDIEVDLLFIDFGLEGHKKAREYLEGLSRERGFTLRVVEIEKEFGMDIVQISYIAGKHICTVCSQLLRYYLLYSSKGYDTLITGHNMTDITAFYIVNAASGSRYSDTLRPVFTTFLGNKKARPFFYLTENRLREIAKERGYRSFDTNCPGENELPSVSVRRMLVEAEERRKGFTKGLLKYFISHTTPSGGNPVPCRLCGMPSRNGICSICRLKQKIERF